MKIVIGEVNRFCTLGALAALCLHGHALFSLARAQKFRAGM